MQDKPPQNRKINNQIILVYWGIAFLGLMIRLYGAVNIEFINTEAAYVMGLESQTIYTESIIQNLTNQLLVMFPWNSELFFRSANLIAGAFFVFLPYYLREQIGHRVSYICAFFFAIDPLLISNSILITGNSFVLLAAGLSLVLFLTKNEKAALWLLISIFFLGRGSSLLIIIGLFVLLFSKKTQRFVKVFISKINPIVKDSRNIQWIVLILLSFFTLLWVSSTSLGIVIQDIGHLFKGFVNIPQQVFPRLTFFIAALVYTPLSFAILLVNVRELNISQSETVKTMLIWLAFSLIIPILNPSRQIIDLVWFSVPLWTLASIILVKTENHIFEEIKASYAFYLILCISFVNMILSIMNLINRLRTGLPLAGTVLSLFTIILFIVALAIYWIFISGFKVAGRGISTLGLLLVFVFQIANITRVIGLSENPEQELFWEGYFPDREMIDKLIYTSTANIFGTKASTEIWVDQDVSPSAYWIFGKEKVNYQISDEFPKDDYFVFFTKDDEIGLRSITYLGQKFTSISYPAWAIFPFQSIANPDFWSWLLIRESPLHQEYNYLWLRTEK